MCYITFFCFNDKLNTMFASLCHKNFYIGLYLCELNGPVTSKHFHIDLLKIPNIPNSWCAIADYGKIVRGNTFTRREMKTWEPLWYALSVIQNFLSWIPEPSPLLVLCALNCTSQLQSFHNYILRNSWMISNLSSVQRQSPFCACALQ